MVGREVVSFLRVEEFSKIKIKINACQNVAKCKKQSRYMWPRQHDSRHPSQKFHVLDARARKKTFIWILCTLCMMYLILILYQRNTGNKCNSCRGKISPRRSTGTTRPLQFVFVQFVFLVNAFVLGYFLLRTAIPFHHCINAYVRKTNRTGS